MVIYSHLATTVVPHNTISAVGSLLIQATVCAADFTGPVVSVLGGDTIEEATISNMWEIAAIVELLEQKGLCTKQDLHTIIDELRRMNPCAQIPETAFPEPYLLTETENTIIDDILELLNKNGLTSHPSQNMLERLGRIIEMGRQIARRTRVCQA